MCVHFIANFPPLVITPTGIKAIKLYAWEEPYRNLIDDVRDKASGAAGLERAHMSLSLCTSL